MNKDLQNRLSKLEDLMKMHRDACPLTDEYFLGMLNGMMLAHSVFSDSSPKFESLHKVKNNIRHKLKNAK
jgi:hypothetical protein